MVTDTLHGILNTDGTLQVESNDRELRIVLSRIMLIDEGKKVETFRSTYYVKDGFEWQQATNSDDYKSTKDFLNAIRNAEDFALAVRDIEQQQKGKRVGG